MAEKDHGSSEKSEKVRKHKRGSVSMAKQQNDMFCC